MVAEMSETLAIPIELSPSYADLGVERIQQVDEEVLLKGDAIS